jgi:adenylate cyclase
MTDVFVSYARSSEADAMKIAEGLRSKGYLVWRDDEIPANRAYSEVIEERLASAKAVIVVWSLDASKSHWVRAEADRAREAGTLIQVTVDGTLPPLPFNQIQCTDLSRWKGDVGSETWKRFEGSVAALAGKREATADDASKDVRRFSICVLPFLNMSGDPEQEYFSDGISEDIITDLSKISAVSVVARNTSFAFKGQSQHVTKIARELNVTHVLEGSVRKAGSRVRINAQLIDGVAGDHIWADRYDRDLTDIFAIQDEISKAIVAALQLKLLPNEKKAIEHRGTSSAEAYNLYLMARQHWITGSLGDVRRDETIVRICRQATHLDPNYARAWALMALSQTELKFWHGKPEDGLATAEKALSLDPNVPEAHIIRARYLAEDGRYDEANEHIETALRLDPNSWEANKEAARLIFRQGRAQDAIPYFEKAAALVDADYHSPLMLVTCYQALGDGQGRARSAQLTVDRAEKVILQDPMNGGALAAGGVGLASLGETNRAKDWIDRALLVAPDDWRTRYNLACALSAHTKDSDGALELLGPYFENVPSVTQIKHAEVDPDLDPLRSDPRFQKMVAGARNRLRGASDTAVSPTASIAPA